MLKYIFSFISLIQSYSSGAISSKFCDPYCATIKQSRTPIYVGPGKNYKILCLYTVSKVPVIVFAKYDHWRKIKDPEGTLGWIHKSKLSPQRFVMMINKNTVNLFKSSNSSSRVIAHIKKNVVMKLLSIRGNWCKVETSYNGAKYIGWINKKNIFGVFDNETQ
jgi:SH3-like domain-containing protein